MLEESRKFNDYDYALVHLFDKYPDYLSFYKESVKMGREVILDNSLYELGKAFKGEVYANWIMELNPTYYIIPDAFNEADKNIEMSQTWFDDTSHLDFKSKTIGVCHGATYDDLVDNYIYFKDRVDKIALSFMEKAFDKFRDKTLHYDAGMSYARVNCIRQMVKDGIIDESKPHHLLGNFVPVEYTEYKSYDWIDSIDTSSPVLAGINGVRYHELGLDSKPKGKLVNFIDKPVENIEITMYNIIKFKELIV
jgi:hypothetical protein